MVIVLSERAVLEGLYNLVVLEGQKNKLNAIAEDAADKEDSDEIIFDDINDIEKELNDDDFTSFSDFLDNEEDADSLLLDGDE